MPGKENFIDRGLDTGKKFNEKTRNIALGVAGGAAFIGGPVGVLAVPALLWAGGDHLTVKGIEWVQEKRAKKTLRSSSRSNERKAAPHPTAVTMQPGREYVLKKAA